MGSAYSRRRPSAETIEPVPTRRFSEPPTTTTEVDISTDGEIQTPSSPMGKIWKRIWPLKEEPQTPSPSPATPTSSTAPIEPTSVPQISDEPVLILSTDEGECQPITFLAPFQTTPDYTVETPQKISNQNVRYQFQRNQITSKRSVVMSELRSSSTFQLDIASPYTQEKVEQVDEQRPQQHPRCVREEPRFGSTYLNRRLGLREWTGSPSKSEKVQMRFVRVIHAASSEPDLSKQPKRSALKGSRKTSQSNLDKPGQSNLALESLSPVALNSESFSLTPPTPGSQLTYGTAAMASSITIQDSPNENTESVSVSQPTRSPPDLGFAKIPVTSSTCSEGGPNMGYASFRLCMPKMSRGSPVLRSSSSSDLRTGLPSNEAGDDETPTSDLSPMLPGAGNTPTAQVPMFSDPLDSVDVEISVHESNEYSDHEMEEEEEEDDSPFSPDLIDSYDVDNDDEEDNGDGPILHSWPIRRDSFGQTLEEPVKKKNFFQFDQSLVFANDDSIINSHNSSSLFSTTSLESLTPEFTPTVPIVEVLSSALCNAGYGPVGQYLEKWLPLKKYCEDLLWNDAALSEMSSDEDKWEQRKDLLTQLADRVRIRRELNDYKMVEMPVHCDSKQNTRFHPS